MRSPLKEGIYWASAAALALPAVLLPIYNPDLFWHLSAGRWIVEHRALPRADFLSFTMPGALWLDFEWLSQFLFQSVYAAGGMAGLWLLKAALLAGIWAALDRALAVNGVSGASRAAALALWSAGAWSYSDIRPELFSVLFFTVLLWLLEARRAGRLRFSPGVLAGIGIIFALWSNLHAGFFFALVLIGIYAAAAAALGRPREAGECALAAAAGLAGSLLNPYGSGPYEIAWEHWQLRAQLSQYIKEWHPITFENPLHWPFWAILGLTAALLLLRLSARGAWRARLPWAPAAAAAYFGAGTLAHARVEPFFNSAAVLAVFLILRDSGWARRRLEAGLAAGLALYALFVGWAMPRLHWDGVFNDKYVPIRAAEFMAANEDALGPLRIYNQWEWGGYLGWRLAPWYRVFGDGRYIFHPQLPETGAAAAESGRWREYMYSHALTGGLFKNIDSAIPTKRVYPDGTSGAFDRPWYLFYMPVDRWALVYWDEQALLFVARDSVPRSWLKAHEYRYVHPKDDAAFADALGRKELPLDRVAEEMVRHRRETAAGG